MRSDNRDKDEINASLGMAAKVFRKAMVALMEARGPQHPQTKTCKMQIGMIQQMRSSVKKIGLVQAILEKKKAREAAAPAAAEEAAPAAVGAAAPDEAAAEVPELSLEKLAAPLDASPAAEEMTPRTLAQSLSWTHMAAAAAAVAVGGMFLYKRMK